MSDNAGDTWQHEVRSWEESVLIHRRRLTGPLGMAPCPQTPPCVRQRSERAAPAQFRSGSWAGFSGVQLTTGVPPLPTVNGTTVERRRDGSETDRHAALPRNVEEGQYRHKLDTDNRTACALHARRAGGRRRENRCSASRWRGTRVAGDRFRSCRVSRANVAGSCI